MKKILFMLAALFGSVAAATAKTDVPNAICISLNDGKESTVEVLFVEHPTICHTATGNVVVKTDDKTMEYPQQNILKITFFRYDKPTSLSEVIGDSAEESQRGIFTLDGRPLQHIEGAGAYIINGKKVLIR